MRLSFLFAILSYITCQSQSQSGVSKDLQSNLLDSIAKLQVKSDTFYSSGLFPSQRVNRKGNRIVEDNNIFFTALTLYTLQSSKSYFSWNDQARIDSIAFKAKKIFSKYRNRNGDITYNFYQVHPENPFPHGKKIISRWRALKLADDLDDTSLLYLIQPTSDSLNRAVKNKMREQSLSHKKVKSTFKPYRSSLAYRTWFAKRMKQDIDICVIANVLTFVFEKKLSLDSIDLKSIELIREIVLNNQHIEYPKLVSPHYQNTSIILYHIARLINVANHRALNSLRSKVISDLHRQLNSTTNQMQKIILLTSLYRLDQKIDFDLTWTDVRKDMQHFYWFKANPLSTSHFWIKKIIGRSDFLNLRFKSEAFYLSLVSELACASKAEMKSGHLLGISSR